MKTIATMSWCLVLLSALASNARCEDGPAASPGPQPSATGPSATTEVGDGQAQARRRDVRGTTGWRENASQGFGLGAMTGSATETGVGPAPQTLQLEYFNLGDNPSEGGRLYGLREDRLEFSGVSNGTPQMAIEGRGMSGWQIFGANDKHPIAFHLGVEPLNFEGQLTTDIVDAARGGKDKPNRAKSLSNFRTQWGYYIPAVSAGIDIHKAGCRFLALVRAGAAGGGQIRDDGNSYGVNAAYGAGVSMNCSKVDVDGEWTRVQQGDAPMDLLNADVMYKPFDKIPLALGVELGSTVTNSQDPKSVPLELPGYGVTGASVETHASAMVRLVF